MVQHKESYFKLVLPTVEDTKEFIIPNGVSWEIQSWVGSANPGRDTHVCIIWDYEGVNEEIIALTYSSLKNEIARIFVGNGSKKLVIALRNDALSSERLGAEFVYREV